MSWKTSITNQTGNRLWVKAVELDITDKPTGIETSVVGYDVDEGNIAYLAERLKMLIDEIGAPTLDEQFESQLTTIDAALASALVPTP